MSNNKNAKQQAEKQQEEKQTTGSMLKELMPYLIMIVVIVLIRVFILINASVPTESMEDTISRKSRVMGLKISYTFSEPERGDIIVFDAPDEPGTDYVKRVIGVPGDTVEVKDGKVFLNGVELSEPYLKEEMEDDGLEFGPEVVPEGSYFCMGDNRNHSWDARFWENTWVRDDAITGKVYLQYWPKLKFIGNSDGDTFAEFTPNNK